jgi:hypothetical protein
MWRYTNDGFRQVARGLPLSTSTGSSGSSGHNDSSGSTAARSSLRLVNRKARAIVDEWPRVIHIAAVHAPHWDGLVAAAPRLAPAARTLRVHISTEYCMVLLATVLPLLGFKNLVSLSLYTDWDQDVDPDGIADLAECLPLFPRLERLEIDLDTPLRETCGLGVLVDAAARHLPELRSLSLRSVRADGSRALRDALASSAWPHLQVLRGGCGPGRLARGQPSMWVCRMRFASTRDMRARMHRDAPPCQTPACGSPQELAAERLAPEAAEVLGACPAGLTVLTLPLLTGGAYGAALRALSAAAAAGRLRCLRQLLLLFGDDDDEMLTVEDVRALRGVELPALVSLVVDRISAGADEDPAPHLAAMRLPRLRRLEVDVCSFEAAAALAAAPWMAGVEELAISGDADVAASGHWLKALAAVLLPSLRILHLKVSSPTAQARPARVASQLDVVRILADAPWLPRLTGLRLQCPYACQEEASAQRAWAALAAAPLHSLRRLAVPDMFWGLYSTRYSPPCAAMMRAAVVGVECMAAAPWLPNLDALELPQDYEEALAIAARRSPAFVQLQARGAVRFGDAMY